MVVDVVVDVDDESQVMFATIETALSLRLKSAKKMRWRGHSLELTNCLSFSKTAAPFSNLLINVIV